LAAWNSLRGKKRNKQKELDGTHGAGMTEIYVVEPANDHAFDTQGKKQGTDCPAKQDLLLEKLSGN